MATSKILLGPIPHARYDWVSGANYGKEAIVFHKGSSYIALSDNPSAEPSFTYDPATGSYNVSAGWGLLAVGAEIVQETGDSQDKAMSQKAVTDALIASDEKLSELERNIANTEENGFYLVDTHSNVFAKYDNNGFDVVKISEHLKTLISQCVFIPVFEKGFFIVDGNYNIGMSLCDNGILAKNLITFDIVKL